MGDSLLLTTTADMRACLEGLGWHDGVLPAEDEERLAQQGYLVLHDVIPLQKLAAMRSAYDEIARIDNRADEFLTDLLNKHAVFQAMIEDPRVLHAVGSVLNWDFKLHSVHGRNPAKGSSTQAFHYDWPVGLPHRQLSPGESLICNSAWMLDDMTEANGPTRVIPGSHLRGGSPAEAMADPTAPQPGEFHIEAPAGSVLIFNGSLWHSGMGNVSGASRRVVHTAFIRRDLPQPEGEVQSQIIRAATLGRLTPAYRHLLQI